MNEPLQNIEHSADALFLMIGAVMIFSMHAGFAFLEAGSVRTKNQVNALVRIFTDWSVSTIVYFLIGFPIAYGISFWASAGSIVPVSIGNFSFAPRDLSVRAGAAVKWTNKDDTPHTITSDDNLFSSPLMDTNQIFSHVFAAPGRFPYHCKLHPTMTGAVVVA